MRLPNTLEKLLTLLLPLLAGTVLGTLLYKALPAQYPVSTIPQIAVYALALYLTCLALAGKWYPLLGRDLRFLDRLNLSLKNEELRVVYVSPALPPRLKEYELLDTNGRSVRRKMSWEDVIALGKHSKKARAV